MIETAAHLIENLIPQVPVRQWVISFPKTIRHFLKTDAILQTVLCVVADEVRKRIIYSSPNIVVAQFGAVSFIQRFGTTLNLHPHFHLVVALFEMKDDSFQFHEVFLILDDIADTQDSIRKRVLKLFGRRGWVEKGKLRGCLNMKQRFFPWCWSPNSKLGSRRVRAFNKVLCKPLLCQ